MQYDLITGEEQKLLTFDKLTLARFYGLNTSSNQIEITTKIGPFFFDPETKELFQILL